MESEPTPPSPPVPAPSAVAAALDAALGATLAATPDAAIAYDDAGRIVAANERACTLLGYPHAALLGLAFAEVLPPAGAGNDWSSNSTA